ncbi:unnamed protein product, partial [Prorocentrum cordatum]
MLLMAPKHGESVKPWRCGAVKFARVASAALATTQRRSLGASAGTAGHRTWPACVVGAVHELVCQRGVRCWFECVHSASNNLDAASTEEGEDALAKLGAKVVKVTPSLTVDLSRYRICWLQ